MKKIYLLIVCILLSNICFANSDYGIISNKRGYILQALEGGALGYICPKWALGNDDCLYGQFVHFNFNHDFVDHQRFSIPRNYYFYADGVYKYTNTENQTKTVRNIELYQKY